MTFSQYILWKDCKSGCKFCTNNGLRDIISKKDALDIIYSEVERDQSEIIGLIGGEFFQNQLDDPIVRQKFLSLIELILSKNITQVMIATSLMNCNFDIIKQVISVFDENNALDKLLICTSYDTKYRFTKAHTYDEWYSTCKKIAHEYGVRIHVEVILTQAFIEYVLSCDSEDDIIKLFPFASGYDILEPHTGILYNKQQFIEKCPEFLPSRNSAMQFMKWWHRHGLDMDRVCNKSNRSDVIYTFVGNHLISISDRSKKSISKTLDIYSFNPDRWLGYCDSNKNIEDDIILIKSMFGN